MKIYAKLLQTKENPFAHVLTLRCTVEADYNGKIFRATRAAGQASWGLCFVMKDGYVAERPADKGISLGTKDGYTYWVSTENRPVSVDYNFNVKKNGKVVGTYRVVYL